MACVELYCALFGYGSERLLNIQNQHFRKQTIFIYFKNFYLNNKTEQKKKVQPLGYKQNIYTFKIISQLAINTQTKNYEKLQ